VFCPLCRVVEVVDVVVGAETVVAEAGVAAVAYQEHCKREPQGMSAIKCSPR
jgi:hypothetical protein